MIYPHQYQIITRESCDAYIDLLNKIQAALLNHLVELKSDEHLIEIEITSLLRFTKKALEHARKIRQEREDERR